MFDSKHIGPQFLRSFLFPFLKMITIFTFFHTVFSIQLCKVSFRWYLLLLSMSRCLYCRCLLLSHSSYLVVLLPLPMMLYVVALLGVSVDYGTLFSVVSLGVECLYSFYDLILILDFSNVLVYECDQSVLV